MMTDCLITTSFGLPALIGLFAGMAVGKIIQDRTALRNPANPEVDDTMGRAIYGICMLVGGVIGVVIQIFITGACGTS